MTLPKSSMKASTCHQEDEVSVTAAALTLAIGLATGLLISRKSGTWCPTCSETKRCLRSHDHPRSRFDRRQR